MGKELGKNIFEQAHEHLKQFMKNKNSIMDDEFVQLAGDFSKVVSFIRGANELIINKKFNAFLNGFSEDEVPTEELIKKLMDYIDDETKAEFISDTFTKVLLSNSSKACLIMGTLLKSMLDEGGKLQHDKLICISSLINFFDIDIANYRLICEYAKWFDSNRNFRGRKSSKRFHLYKLSTFVKEKNVNYSSLLLTLEKAVGSQLLIRSYEADIEVSYNKDSDSTDVDQSDIDEYYSFSPAGLIMKEYINRIKDIN